MTKVPHPFLTIRLPEDEKAILDAYCYDTRQTKTDVLRQFIRGLKLPISNPRYERIDALQKHQKWLEDEGVQIVDELNLDEGLWKIAADITQVENEILEEYCYNTNQKKSDVIRSLIRSLRVERGENSHAVMRVDLGKTEAKLLDDYCSRNNTTPTSAIRQLIRDTDSNDLEIINKRMELKESDWRATFDTTNKSTATGVGQKFLRSMSSTKPGTGVYFIEEHYRPKAISPEEAHEWLQSLGAESDQELADAASLRAMAAHMLTIAERLEK